MNRYILFTIAVLSLFSSCRSAYYLPQPAEFKEHVKGLHFEGTLKSGERVEGEIIAVEEERLYLRPNLYADIKMHTITKDILIKGDIIVSITSDKAKSLSTNAALINLIPLVHGYAGIFSIPITVITTVAVSLDAAKSTYRLAYPKDLDWNNLYKFARFPQGIPAAVNLSEID